MSGVIRTLAAASLLTFAFGCGGGGEVQIHKVKPRNGPMKGNEPVKIKGENFRTDIGYTVYFGPNKAKNVTIMNPETMVATAPEADEGGTVDMLVTADNGPAWRIHDAFTYKEMEGNVVEKMGETEGKGNLKY